MSPGSSPPRRSFSKGEVSFLTNHETVPLKCNEIYLGMKPKEPDHTNMNALSLANSAGRLNHLLRS